MSGVITVFSALSVSSVLTALTAQAQIAPPYTDARLVPRGALRIGFEPSFRTYEERFAPDGTREPLGADFSADSAGVRLFPTASAAEVALRAITGDAAYTISAGRFRTALDADIRRFPLNVSFGLTSRLTLLVSVPIVTTRMQADFVVDSATANVGINPAAGTAAAVTQIQQLLVQLEAGAASVDAQIAAGAFGCPTSAMCDQARDLVLRARRLKTDLIALTGVPESGAVAGPLPPFAPLASSTAAAAVVAAIQSLSSELQSFGAAGITASLPLPAGKPAASDINGVLTNPEFGYDALSIGFVKYTQKLGDVEVGFRLGLVQSAAFRVALTGTARLPTGTRDLANHFIDLGTGDRQTDLAGGLEVALEPGSVISLGAAASYTVQLPDVLPRRVTSPDRPIAPAATEVLVDRDLGDVIEVSVYPALRLNPSFTAYFAGHYLNRRADRITLASGAPAVSVDPRDLEQETAMQVLSFGGGIYFRPPATDRRLPVEAGIDYRAAFQGDGGLAPKAMALSFYARLFYRIFGGRGSPER